jgi:hypothetical protein
MSTQGSILKSKDPKANFSAERSSPFNQSMNFNSLQQKAVNGMRANSFSNQSAFKNMANMSVHLGTGLGATGGPVFGYKTNNALKMKSFRENNFANSTASETHFQLKENRRIVRHQAALFVGN